VVAWSSSPRRSAARPSFEPGERRRVRIAQLVVAVERLGDQRGALLDRPRRQQRRTEVGEGEGDARRVPKLPL
jgi:hypothetical protein